jgi:hypothetical protein
VNFWLTSIAVALRYRDNPLTVTELQIHGEPFRARAGARLPKGSWIAVQRARNRHFFASGQAEVELN